MLKTKFHASAPKMKHALVQNFLLKLSICDLDTIKSKKSRASTIKSIFNFFHSLLQTLDRHKQENQKHTAQVLLCKCVQQQLPVSQ